MLPVVTRVLAAKILAKSTKALLDQFLDKAVATANSKRFPNRSRRTAASAAIPSAAIGGLLMYLFDPAAGPARRRSLLRAFSKSEISGSEGVTVNVRDMQERSKQVIDLAARKETAGKTPKP